MRRLLVTFSLSAAILVGTAIVPDSAGPGSFGTPKQVECCARA